MNRQLKLSLLMQADASSLKREAAEARSAIDGIGAAAGAAAPRSSAAAAANDDIAVSARRVVDALAGQSRAELQLADAINRRLGIARQVAQVGDPFAQDQRRAADIAAYGAALDELRARYNPLFAEMKRHEGELTAIRRAHAVGAIGAQEMAAAILRERQAHQASVTAIRSRTAAIREMNAAGRFETANIAAQFQDVGVTAAMGMNPMLIALQQGTQLSAVLNGMQNPLRGLAAAFLSVVNPVSLLTVGMVGLTAAAIQYFTSVDDEASAVDAVLEAHGRNIADIRAKWGDAAAGIEEYQKRSADLLVADAIVIGDELRKQIDAAAQALIDGGELLRTETKRLNDELERVSLEYVREPDPMSERAMALFEEMVRLQTAIADAGSDALVAADKFAPLRKEVDAFAESVRRGTPDFVALQNAVAKAVRADPTNEELLFLKRRIDELTEAGAELQRRLPGNAAAIEGVGQSAVQASARVDLLGRAMADLAKIAVPSLSDAAAAAAAFDRAMAETSGMEERLGVLKEYERAMGRIRGSLLDDLAKKEREVAIAGMSDRDAAAARIRDEYDAMVEALREAGVAEEDVARATRLMNTELAQSTARFDELEAKAGEKGAAKAMRDFEREAQRANDRINDMIVSVGEGLSDAFSRPIESIWDLVDALASALGNIGNMFMRANRYDWAAALGLSVTPQALAAAAGGGAARSAPALYVGPSPASPAGGSRAASELQGYVPQAVAAIERTSNAFLGLVRRAEGTAGANGYNVTLGYGAFTGGATNLTGMTLDQIDALQTAMLRHPNNSYNSSAVGAYQIVRTTLRGLRDELGLSGSQLFTPQLQDDLAMRLASRRGASVAGLRNEWEGLRRVDGGTILAAYSGAANDNARGAIAAPTVSPPASAPIPTAAPAQDAAAGGQGGAGRSGFGGQGVAALGAGLAGFSSGYQSQNPVAGVLSGALGGIAAGPWGMAAGALGGLIGGIIGWIKAMKEAQAEIRRMQNEIDMFVSAGMGTGVSQLGVAIADYGRQAEEYRKLARKAEDYDLVNRINQAEWTFQNRMRADFAGSFNGNVAAMMRGGGLDNDFNAGYSQVLAMRDELTGFVADARTAFGDGSAEIARAQVAAQQAALGMLSALDQLSPMQSRMEGLKGTAAALTQTLVDLGMSAGDAAASVQGRLAQAIEQLRVDYLNEVNASINSLLGAGHVTEIAEAQARYNERLRDMAELGLDASLAGRELSLTLARIATQSGLSGDELRSLAGSLGVASDAVTDAIGVMESGAMLVAATFEDLSLRLLQLGTDMSTLEGQLRVLDRQSEITVRRLKAQGASAQELALTEAALAAERQKTINDFNRRGIDQAKNVFDQTLDAYRSFVEGLQGYRTGLSLNPGLSALSASERVDLARGDFEKTFEAALAGDRAAMEKYQAAANAYLEQEAAFSSSSERYAAAFKDVQDKTRQLEERAVNQVSLAEQQLAVMQGQVSGLEAANDNLLSLVDATAELRAAIDTYLGAGGSFTGAVEGAVAAANHAMSTADLAVAAAAMAAQSAIDNAKASLSISASMASITPSVFAIQRAVEIMASQPPTPVQTPAPAEEKPPTFWERLGNWIGGIFGFADGGAFVNGRQVQAFGTGGLVTQPTLFPMGSGGIGIMAERGTEAIMPIARDGRGRMGVHVASMGANDNAGVRADLRELARATIGGSGAMLTELRALRAENVALREEFSRMREEFRIQGERPVRATGTSG